MEYDFSGWATRNDLKCSDGRTIRRDAFKSQSGQTVPLVYNHMHDDPTNVLGHAVLENRDEGVYAYCVFNNTPSGEHAKEMVKHGDVKALSIYANQLIERAGDVLHGAIREVSLVLAGANPGAYIDAIIEHSEGSEFSAIIYTGEEISLEHADEPKSNNKETAKEEPAQKDEGKKEETIQDVLDTFNEKQRKVLNYFVTQALEDESSEENDKSEGGKEMKHNVFEADGNNTAVLSHSDMEIIIKDGKRLGSLKESVLQHSAEYGVENIDFLFPDAQTINNEPSFIKRKPDAWVGQVMDSVHHTPFAKIKSVFADITADEARAKGYIKGKRKQEEVFTLLKRTTSPTTVYKKQKLDRDDVIDITSFNVVRWMKGEMRGMLDEEIARAILVGDGRLSSSDDKINEQNIRPIVSDDDLYAIKAEVIPASGETLSHALITTAVKAQDDYQGSGNLTLYAENSTITTMLLMEDADGHRLYKNLTDLAMALNVDRITKLPKGIMPAGVYGIIVDLKDYNVGADKGGEVSLFDDFDIDYNQMKYLIETRCSGALVKPYSAIVLKAQAAG